MAQSKEQGAADPVRKGVAEATQMLIEQMEAINTSMLASLRIWDRDKIDPEGGESGDCDYFLNSAVKLAEVSAKIGETLAKMKAETRQHISVQRLAAPSSPAPIEEAQYSLEALIQRRKFKRSGRIEGEWSGARSPVKPQT